MMLYPLKFIPVYKNMIWGGNRLHSYFSRKIPGEKIGESWELCCRDDGMSVVKNGRLQGKTLQELIDTYKEKLVGTEIYQKYGEEFPLLIKIIDASDSAPILVEQGDVDTAKAWYIIDAEKETKVVYNLKQRSKAKVEKAILEGRISQLLNEIPVKPGDFVSIPVGTLHALRDGSLVAEIQSNNGTEFPLDNQRTLDATRFGARIPEDTEFQRTKQEGRGILRFGPSVQEFQVDELKLNGALSKKSTPESLQVIMNLKGYGKLMYFGGCLDLYPGDTVLIPAALGDYCIFGAMKLLVVHKKRVQEAKGAARSEDLPWSPVCDRSA